jgi:hypothetical protein
VWTFLRPYLENYDAAVFTLGSFAPKDLPVQRVEIIPPAIDPESPKSIDLDLGLARRVLQWIGVELDRPLLTQVSRFDPWKDPLGVIAAYRLVKRDVPMCNSRWLVRWRSMIQRGGIFTARCAKPRLVTTVSICSQTLRVSATSK